MKNYHLFTGPYAASHRPDQTYRGGFSDLTVAMSTIPWRAMGIEWAVIMQAVEEGQLTPLLRGDLDAQTQKVEWRSKI